jgi:ligand-binding sensor domain-containing protein
MRQLALGLALAITSSALAQEARPGHTLVLHHGHDPSAAVTAGGLAHDARLAFALPETAPTSRLSIAMPGTRMRGPVVDASGRVFVGTSSGVTIVEPDGHASHDVVVGALEAPPVIVPGGDVVALARDGMLARIAPDGRVVMRAASLLGIRFAPLVRGDGALIVVAASRTLAELGPDLSVRRARELPDGLALSPTETARGHYAIAAGAELVFVDPHGLEVLRTIPLPDRAATPVARAEDGTLWVATVDGDLLRVHGELRIGESIALGARLPEAATLDRAMLGVAPGGDVLVAVPSRGLVRIAPSGAERWIWSGEAPLIGALSVDGDGRTAVIDRTGHLSVIAADGTPDWTLALGAVPLGAAMTTPQGRIVVATDQGVLLLGPS